MTAKGAEWISNYGREQHKKAVQVSLKHQKEMSKKKTQLIKICDKPPTYKEVVILE